MASLPSLLVNAVTTFDGKALTKGSKQISGFEKGIKSLGKTLGVTFGATALLKFGKDSVKAFAENEKSALRLATVVKNLGLAFEVPQIEKGLDEISARYGYQGEVLREAFQKLLTVTGSAAKSQDLLNLSLNVAAGSGQDLLTVNQDLAAVYVGNTKGLRKYNLGLAQSELKTLKFDDAVALLTKTFKGSADAELTTFSGKMKVLGEAAGNAQEIIGGGLVKSLSLLAGEGNSVQPLADSMGEVATNTSEVIVGIGVLAQKLNDLPAIGKSFSFVFSKNNPGLLSLLGRLGETELGKNTIGDKQLGGLERRATIEANAKARAKAEAAALARAKALAALQAKAAQSDKAKIALSKASTVFDSSRISIAAALRSTYDKETKLRLEALMLIEQDKGEEALKKIDELAKLQNNADMQRLAGVETISGATLQALNTQLLTELRVINESRMAEGNKELARAEAFKKYNAAIIAAGTLAAKESYDERVQIQLTEIARLASISKTTSAAATARLLLESSELQMISRVAIAQKAADDQRLAALRQYARTLDSLGGGGAGNSLPQGLVEDTLVSLGVQSIEEIPSLNTGGLSDAQLDLIDAVSTFLRLFPDDFSGNTPEVNVMVVLDGDAVAGAVSQVQTNNNLSGSFTTVGGRGANTARFL